MPGRPVKSAAVAENAAASGRGRQSAVQAVAHEHLEALVVARHRREGLT